MNWLEFTLALTLFLASHRIPAMVGVKASLIAAFGPRGFTAVFSLVSTLLLFWLIAAAGRAPYVALWDQALWQRWVVNITMPLALALIVFGTAAPNPFAFEGRATGYDPLHPGVAGLTRQPMLWGLAMWSGAHLLANGDLAHVILFGGFAMFSILGMRTAERGRARRIGEVEWQRLASHTRLIPFAALLTGRWRPATLPSRLRFAVWLMVWIGLWHLHTPVIGVSPAP